MALLHLAARDEGAGPLVVLHVNHCLRGADADGDEAFVCALAARLGVDCHVERVDVAGRAASEGANVEAVGRRVRYAAANALLDELCARLGVPPEQGRIATAHTADDRIENFLMRAIVGTGPGGLRGMDAASGRVVRPLLHATRAELREWLASQGETWREDATNADTEHFRAYVRHEVVPVMRAANPRFAANLTRTMDLVADEHAMLEDHACRVAEEVARPGAATPRRLALDGPALAAHPRPVQRRVLARLLKGFLPEEVRVDNFHIEALCDGLACNGFSRTLPCRVQVHQRRGLFTIDKPEGL